MLRLRKTQTNLIYNLLTICYHFQMINYHELSLYHMLIPNRLFHMTMQNVFAMVLPRLVHVVCRFFSPLEIAALARMVQMLTNVRQMMDRIQEHFCLTSPLHALSIYFLFLSGFFLCMVFIGLMNIN